MKSHNYRSIKSFVLILITGLLVSYHAAHTQSIDLTEAGILISPHIKSPVRETIVRVLIEEVAKRTEKQWKQLDHWPENQRPLVAIALDSDKTLSGKPVPSRTGNSLPEKQAEGYRVLTEKQGDKPVVWIIGHDARGALFGVGELLRTAAMTSQQITLPHPLHVATAPAYPLRGHQLGYRNTANSWDAWTVEQYEQYIRELVLFGTNAIEDIPFDPQSALMKLPAGEMHRKISEICAAYGIEYWVWTPAAGDLTDENKYKEGLKEHEEFYKNIPRLDNIFFPGGDPGDNHPKYVMPHLKDMAALLHKYHPEAGLWISLQGFDEEMVDYFFDYLEENEPDWLKGVVYGPSSPPIEEERRRLPEKYMHRLYGDLTHTVRCQYPTENWDQAYALTLGREPTNPEPYYYAHILRTDMPFTDGFLSYSDGVHDDVNKVVWNQIGWRPDKNVREIIMEYGRFFFGPDVAQQAADGILALERNWDGSLVANGAVEGTLQLWQTLEAQQPELSTHWRWQQLVMRAYYDAYTRRRLIYEQKLEREANALLAQANTLGAKVAMDSALTMVKQADTAPIAQELKAKIVEYCADLFQSVGLQTSVEKYQARSAERGCVLDFVDYPLNNRWWLEDEFEKIRTLRSEKEKLNRLDLIRTWENPGPGSYYDNISNVAASPHVTSRTDDAIDYAWWDNGRSRKRLSTQLFQFAPTLEYHRLDPEAEYIIRVAGYGEALLKANGQRLTPAKYDKELETFKEFHLPKELIKDGYLVITFDRPDESHLNWRQYSKVTDVWLLKQ